MENQNQIHTLGQPEALVLGPIPCNGAVCINRSRYDELVRAEADILCQLLNTAAKDVESLIQKHSYARSPIRTYGEEDVLGEESQTTQSRGKAMHHQEMWNC